MHILITGGTGMIGRRLCAALLADGHQLTVLSRRPQTVAAICGAAVHSMADLHEYHSDMVFDAIINLAGEAIADARWSPARQQILRTSRIALTELLLQKVHAAQRRPQVFLSGSAVGFYGDSGATPLSEQAAAGGDFSAQLCVDWEAAANQAAAMGIRTCILRTGLVLDASGGMLKKMHLPFQLGLGARLGQGSQWMSWVHVADYVDMLRFLLTQTEAAGCFNMVAPEPVSNRQFTAALAHALHRPAPWLIPAFVLRLAMGEMSSLLLGGQRVLPAKISALGYRFRFTRLADALADLYSSR